MDFDWDALERNYQGRRRTATPGPQKKKKGFWMDNISTGGGIAGSLGGAAAGAAIGSVVPVVGTAIGGLIGGIAGGALGSGGGELAENFLTNEDDKFRNVGRETLLGGVFSAPPIRAARGAIGAGKALMSGAGGTAAKQSLEQALTQPGMLARAAGGALGKSADNFALKSFNINDSNFLTQFKKNIGEDAGTFARRFNFVGKEPEQITTQVFQPLQAVYKQAIASANPIDKAEIVTGFKSVYEPLLKSMSLDEQALGQRVKAQAELITGRLSAKINPSDAYDAKVLFDSLVDQKLTDTAGKLGNNVNKQIADVFRSAINKASANSNFKIDPASLPVPGVKATNLQQLGKELQGIMEFADKAAIKENVGRGKNVIGLSELLGGAVGGGAFGNPLGAAGAAVATRALNSNAGERLALNAAESTANRLQAPRNPLGIPGMAGRQAAGGLAVTGVNQMGQPNSLEDAMMQAQSSLDGNSNPTAAMANMSAIPPRNANMGASYQNSEQMSTSPYSKEGLFADIQRDPANSDYYIDLYKQLQEVYAPAGSDLSSTAATQLASSDNAIGTLDQLEGLYSSAGGGGGKLFGGIGNLASRAGLNDAVQSYNDLSASSVSQLARAINGGGQVSDADAAVVIQALPKITDSPEVARIKFAALKQRLATARQNTFMYGGGGSDDLAGALLEAQP